MAKYTFKRILWMIPILLCTSFIVYLIMDLAPGDIVDMIKSEGMTAEQLDDLRHQYGLDQPLFIRYVKYMFGFIQGDLGYSLLLREDVASLFFSRFPRTLELALTSTAIAVVISIPVGIIAATHAGSVIDNICTVVALFGVSMPSFWFALMMILIFSVNLHWFPTGGNYDGIRSLVLPAVSCAVVTLATLVRQTRSSMLEVLNQDYLRTARAKGVKERRVIYRHALRNALIPVITVLGDGLAFSLTGAFVIESVFGWEGVGSLIIQAVRNRDTTLATGCVILVTIIVTLVMLLVDLLYAAADPRIKAQFSRGGQRK